MTTFPSFATDQRILALLDGNTHNELTPLPDDTSPPRSWRALGYEQAAVLLGQYYQSNPEPDGRVRTISASALRNYWRIDLSRGYSHLMPPPDAIIERGLNGELLPGWAPETLLAWVPYRVGAGNHTRGEDRVGNFSGRTGWRLIDGEWVRPENVPAGAMA